MSVELGGKIEECRSRLQELERLMSDSEVMRDSRRYAGMVRDHRRLAQVVSKFELQQKLRASLRQAQAMQLNEKDPEMRGLCEQEAEELKIRIDALQEALMLLLVPPDPMDNRNIIMEIRAGTGGDEASLFAADLYRMYLRYAESRKWKIEMLSLSEQEQGGYKEVIFEIRGESAYSYLRHESGTHRVQRVPATESAGRIHTSAATVAVLPEAEEVDVQIEEKDLRIDTYRSQGAGGQHVNTTDSAVRITHLPTGVVVQCQDERSQIKNRSKAMKVLLARLLEHQVEQNRQQRAAERKDQVGSGDRSERIRTYNFPQNRLTDHRVNLTLYRLDSVLLGDLDMVIGPLMQAHQQQLLEQHQLTGNK